MWRTILSSVETYEIILVINQWFNRQINKKTNTWKLIESMFNSPERNYHCGNSKNYYHQEQAPYWNIKCFAQTQTSLTQIRIKKWLKTIIHSYLQRNAVTSYMVCDILYVTCLSKYIVWPWPWINSIDLKLKSFQHFYRYRKISTTIQSSLSPSFKQAILAEIKDYGS